MNTYYTLTLTQKERDLLLYLAEVGYDEQLATWEYAPEHPKRLACEVILDTLRNAEEHPNVEDVCEYEAKHTGHKAGDKVLVEGVIKRDMRDGNYHVTFSRDVSVMWSDSDRFDGLDVPEYYVNPAE